MSHAAKSLVVFAVYLLFVGTGLLVVPNQFLKLFDQPETTEVWIRVVGMLLVILAIYYIHAARHELTAFFRITVYGRASVSLFFAVFVLAEFAPPILLLFGGVDLVAAIWTGLALHSRT